MIVLINIKESGRVAEYRPASLSLSHVPIDFGVTTYTTVYLTRCQRAHTGINDIHWSFSVDQYRFSPIPQQYAGLVCAICV